MNPIEFSQDCVNQMTEQFKKCFTPEIKTGYGRKDLRANDAEVKKVESFLNEVKNKLENKKIKIKAHLAIGKANKVPYLVIYDARFDYRDLSKKRQNSQYSPQSGVYICGNL